MLVLRDGRIAAELAGAARELTTRIFGGPIRLMVGVAFAAGVLMTLRFWLGHGGARFWRRGEGRPPHPKIAYGRTTIPVVRRRR